MESLDSTLNKVNPTGIPNAENQAAITALMMLENMELVSCGNGVFAIVWADAADVESAIDAYLCSDCDVLAVMNFSGKPLHEEDVMAALGRFTKTDRKTTICVQNKEAGLADCAKWLAGVVEPLPDPQQIIIAAPVYLITPLYRVILKALLAKSIILPIAVELLNIPKSDGEAHLCALYQQEIADSVYLGQLATLTDVGDYLALCNK